MVFTEVFNHYWKQLWGVELHFCPTTMWKMQRERERERERERKRKKERETEINKLRH